MELESEIFDDDDCYDLVIWVEAEKSIDELEKSLSKIIEPVKIENHRFSIGRIACEIIPTDSGEVPAFASIPQGQFAHRIVVPRVDTLIWGCFDLQFALALTLGIRTTFSCRYMVTANDDFFVMYSGTGLPTYINTLFSPWASGELNGFRRREVVEMTIPRNSKRSEAI